MTKRVFNFSAGPAVMPEPVLAEARDALFSLGETGVGICEHSHRSKAFVAVAEETEALCRELAGIPDDYSVLFLQGGASSQFFMVPMNFLARGVTADFLNTGAWSKKAIAEARLQGETHEVCTSAARNFCYIPKERNYSDNPAYVHYTSNNTIFGTQFRNEPEDLPEGSFLVCDASSDIFSRPVDVTKYGLIYAGGQKNLGPAGVTLVIVRRDLIERGSNDLPAMLQYRTHDQKGSMYNTPPTFGIYLMGLVLKWLKQQGGLAGIQQQNEAKAARLYDYLDCSQLFQPTADPDSRSLMNVTFVTGNVDLDAMFVAKATEAGLHSLKGHRSVGGMRASLYNAFPLDGVDALIEMMRNFEVAHAEH